MLSSSSFSVPVNVPAAYIPTGFILVCLLYSIIYMLFAFFDLYRILPFIFTIADNHT